jgi:hypothetical protein
MTVIIFPELFINLEEAVIIAWVLLGLPSMNLLVEEVIHYEIAVDTSSNIHIIYLRLLEIGINGDL